MKDIIIKGRSVKRELWVLLCCFVVVNLWNVYAIITYKGVWTELFSVWYAVLFVTGVVYVLSIPVRLLGCAFWKLLKKRMCRKSNVKA